jgi:hypothetical protein
LFSSLFTLPYSLFSKEAVVSENSEKRIVKRNGIPFGDEFEIDFQ